MLIKKVCEICGTDYFVPHWRADTAKYCSVRCQRKSLVRRPNVTCVVCGKQFHVKPYYLKRLKHPPCCSLKCSSLYRKVWFRVNGNHQYGLKGNKNSTFLGDVIFVKNNKLTEVRKYAPYRVDANKAGRVLEHRLLVEENWELFDECAFDIINGQHVLKKDYVVHHIDGNHGNNDIRNLIPITKSEHNRIHIKLREIVRDKETGRIITTYKK